MKDQRQLRVRQLDSITCYINFLGFYLDHSVGSYDKDIADMVSDDLQKILKKLQTMYPKDTE